MTALGALARRSIRAARPRRIRLREREFWRAQALVAVATAIVYSGDRYLDSAGMNDGLHDVLTTIYLLPVLYASFTYGLEGALLTMFWCALLAAPHAATSPHSDQLVSDAGVLSTILVASVAVVLRVEGERVARERAEAITRRLSLLNEIATALAGRGRIGVQLQSLVDRIRSGLDLDFVGLMYAAEDGRGGGERSHLLVTSGDGGFLDAANRLSGFAPTSNGVAVNDGDTALTSHGWIAVPLAADQRSFGVLGAGSRGHALSHDQRQVIAIAALQTAVALDNLWLEEQRGESLREYARSVTRAQEEERRRLARDLHDGVTQTLSGLCRELDLLQGEIVDVRNSVTVARLREEAAEALVDIRRVARDLRPAILDDLGLVPAIESLGAELAARTGLRVTVRQSGRHRRLPTAHQLCVFRIVQEALTNVEKHARASNVAVEIASDERSMLVTVQDDGVGFQAPSSPADFARGGRFGLFGMRERAALHDGVLDVRSEPGRGTTVKLHIDNAATAEDVDPTAVRRSSPR